MKKRQCSAGQEAKGDAIKQRAISLGTDVIKMLRARNVPPQEALIMLCGLVGTFAAHYSKDPDILKLDTQSTVVAERLLTYLVWESE